MPKISSLVLFVNLLVLSAETVAQQAPDSVGTDSARVASYAARAVERFKQDEDSAAHRLLDSAIQLAEAARLPSMLGEMHYRRTYFWASRGEDRKAYTAGIVAAGITSDQAILGKIYNLIGNAATNLGLLDEAIDAYYKSLDARQASGASDLELSRTYLNLGGALAEAKKPDESLRYYLKSADLKKQAGDSSGLGRLFNNIAINFKNAEEYEKAMAYLDSSLHYSASPAPIDLYSVLMTRAQLLKRMGQLDKASKIMHAALSAAAEAKNRYRTTDAYINLSDLSNVRGQYRNAVAYGEKADSLSRDTRSFSQLMHLNHNLSTAWRGLGNMKLAVHYLENAVRWKDSLYQEEQVFAQEAMQVRYETALKDKQLAEQEVTLNESKLQLVQRKWIIITLALVLLLMLLMFAFFRQRTHRRQLYLQQEAEKERVKTVMRATEQERGRIAADIHDGLGQLVTSLRLQLQQQNDADQRLPLVHQLQTEIRNVAFDLMPAALAKGGLAVALSEYSHFVSENTPLTVRFQSAVRTLVVAPDQQIHVYRIVQEWVNNIVKYSGASTVHLQLSADATSALVSVEDDGNGFDKTLLDGSKGQGWINIRTRANLIGGLVWVESQPGSKGTVFTLEIKSDEA